MDDAGMTLIEMIVASSLLVVLTTIVAVAIGVLNQVTINVSASYQGYNQILPALTPLRPLLRAEVEPAPPASDGTPSPGFASAGAFSLTFYSNIGTTGGNVVACVPTTGTTTTTAPCTGSSAGPAKFEAKELDANGAEVSPSTVCTTKSGGGTCSFVVRRYLPTTNNGVSACPGVGTGPNCTYQSTFTQILTITGVANNPQTPVFTYTTTSTPDSRSAVATACASSPLVSLNSVTPLLATSSQSAACQLDAIKMVDVDILVGVASSDSNKTVETHLISFRNSQFLGSGISPYQYSTSVG